MKNDTNNTVIDLTSNSDGDDNTLPAFLPDPTDKSYEKPEKLQNRIKLIELIKEKIDDDKLYICLDIEAFERNHDFLTEFGWCIFKKNGEVIKKKHAIVEENKNYRNGRYVPDNRDYFKFGESQYEKLEDIYKELKNDFDKVNYLVGHGINNDIRFLKKIKVDVSKFKKMNSGSKIDDYGIIETMDLFSGYFLKKPVGLQKSLIKLEIQYDKLHNAGNDAYYTMQVFLEIIKRFDFSSNRLYEQIMNYKPPKKIKSNNNKNNKIMNNNNTISTSNNGGVGNSSIANDETDQGRNDRTIIGNSNDSEKSINNNTLNYQSGGNNNKNYNKNNRSNNKDNEGGNNTKNNVKKNGQRRNNGKQQRNLNKKKSYSYPRSNRHNNNYNNSNNLKV
ncbi:hypothetical protein BCR36DRAFT_412845 [Piromyces finnis]|uniref:Gfd2/YDR514C-like C-terminal domain-containing protein n=1 Tax=Piromyces finnis TaxID=1754191 RepID=A0A1Y1V7W8_9FUNG|nr:hypothetical protein BCR36DRAFT_412845 [Piromyces finnis]|eukprot:ORX49329.1 hypothetical protein BCR36DRAFT_412845 [Piromyces finnis]